MNKLLAIGVAAVLVLLLLIFSTTYTVSFHEVAIQQTFGQSTTDNVKFDPGLKLKLPLLQDKQKLDTRLQILESPLEEIALADGQQIVVRAFLLWRVDVSGASAEVAAQGAIDFATRYESISSANEKLRDPFLTEITSVLSQFEFDDIVGEEHQLEKAEQAIQQAMSALAGIDAVSVGISQLVLPERATTAVISRMEATRARQAEAYRNLGQAEANGIASAAATIAEKIRIFAEQRAAEIRAEAEERAAEYMASMSEEEELAIFLAWLDTLEQALATNSTIFLDGRHDPWHVMNLHSRLDEHSIPQPEHRLAADADGERNRNVQNPEGE